NLPENEAYDNLLFVTDECYHDLILREKCLDKALDGLIKTKYNKENFQEYLNELRDLKLSKNSNIREYMNKFNEILVKVNLCVDKNEQITQREKEELFIAGLPRWIVEEYVKLIKSNHEERVEVLKQLEDLKIGNKSNDRSYHQGIEKVKFSKKWCPLHKTNLHDKRECYALVNKNKDLKKDLENKTKERDYKVIKELVPSINKLEIQVELENHKMKGLIDTGAMSSYIAKEV
ncbi:hypothetical protein H311_00458, partial [Anncaliia algerae PRA109]